MSYSSTTENQFIPISGSIHSVQPLSLIEGPGRRFVVFTQGCPLRCLYCHRPDCRHWADGKSVTVEQLMSVISAYAASPDALDGITITGGEPLMQPYFVRELCSRCKQLGLHTIVATSGYAHLHAAEAVFDFADLALLNIKSYDPEIYKRLTDGAIAPTLALAQYLNRIQKPTWVRFVLVPGLTDAPHNIAGLADFVATLKNVERMEVLPFHKTGEYRWEQLHYNYQLKDIQPPTPEQMQAVHAVFRSRGINVV